MIIISYKYMRVVLLKDVKGLGRRGDVKDVSDGYARNFLLQEKIAKIATPEVVAKIEREKTLSEERRKELILKLKVKEEKLKEKTLEFFLKIGAKGEIFGSVSAVLIEKALRDEGFEKINILLDRPIKTLGTHEIEADFGEGVKTKIRISVKTS